MKNKNLWLHISFWSVFLSFNVYQISVFQRRMDTVEWQTGLLLTASQMFFVMAIAYFNYFLLLPKFLQRRNWWVYIAQFIVPFCLTIFARVSVEREIVQTAGYFPKYFHSSTYIIHTTAITFFIVVFISLMRFVSEWADLESARKEVQNEKLTAELNFLKAQINPHFLFNTLNNLYYLAYSKSENTTEVIAKLSQVMRYMIYDCNHERVPLTKEIEYMQNYVDLERLRLNNQIPIDLKISGDVGKVSVAPLILMTFLENAFKHGVTTSSDAWVNIALAVNDSQLVYTVENSKIEKAAIDNGGKSGIGLANVRRRLELVYPGQYTLNVDDSAERYYIELKINLS